MVYSVHVDTWTIKYTIKSIFGFELTLQGSIILHADQNATRGWVKLVAVEIE